MTEKTRTVSGRRILGAISGLTVLIVASVGYFLGSMDPARTTDVWIFTIPQTPHSMAIFGVIFALGSFSILYLLVEKAP